MQSPQRPYSTHLSPCVPNHLLPCTQVALFSVLLQHLGPAGFNTLLLQADDRGNTGLHWAATFGHLRPLPVAWLLGRPVPVEWLGEAAGAAGASSWEGLAALGQGMLAPPKPSSQLLTAATRSDWVACHCAARSPFGPKPEACDPQEEHTKAAQQLCRMWLVAAEEALGDRCVMSVDCLNSIAT